MRRDDGIGVIEVVFAIVLMAIVSLIALPQLAQYQANRDLRHAARLLGGDLRLTQQYAITQDEKFRLIYTATPTSGYTIVKVSDSSVLKQVDLPATVTVTGAFASTPAEFSSTGAPTQSGAFCLTDGVGIMKVDVLTATGRVNLGEVSVCP